VHGISGKHIAVVIHGFEWQDPCWYGFIELIDGFLLPFHMC